MRQHVFLLLSVAATGALGWINSYDQEFHFQCEGNTFLSHLASQHHNGAEDRLWDFACSALPLAEAETSQCEWTLNYVNELDLPVAYHCPNEGFLTGVQSVHNNAAEDRQFKFRCCIADRAVSHNCFYTNWENQLDGPLDYMVPPGKILTGIISYHDNDAEDRRFKFEICDFDFSTSRP